MSVWKRVRKLVADPPPEYAFEISEAGIAFAHRMRKELKMGFQPLAPGVLEITPLRDNVAQPETLFAQVKALAPNNGKRRHRASLILPDFCSRVAVLDFDNLPSSQEERESLIRFRMKRSIPFDLDSARVSFHVQSSSGKKIEVVAAVLALEIVARYEAAFRSAGFDPGFVSTSSLAALNLLEGDGLRVVAKLSGPVLTAAVTGGGNLHLLRCVELPVVAPGEVTRVLYPTFAYVEDELKARPAELLLCGFGEMEREVAEQCQAALGVEVGPVRSKYGHPDGTNAGLLGFLKGTES